MEIQISIKFDFVEDHNFFSGGSEYQSSEAYYKNGHLLVKRLRLMGAEIPAEYTVDYRAEMVQCSYSVEYGELKFFIPSSYLTPYGNIEENIQQILTDFFKTPTEIDVNTFYFSDQVDDFLEDGPERENEPYIRLDSDQFRFDIL